MTHLPMKATTTRAFHEKMPSLIQKISQDVTKFDSYAVQGSVEFARDNKITEI